MKTNNGLCHKVDAYKLLDISVQTPQNFEEKCTLFEQKQVGISHEKIYFFGHFQIIFFKKTKNTRFHHFFITNHHNVDYNY